MSNDMAKIVLQADLSKSADTIAKQLPRLSDEVARRGKLKIQAVIDPVSIREQALSAMQRVQSLLAGNALSLSVSLNTEKIVLTDQLAVWMQKNTAQAQRFQSQLDRLRESLDGLSGVQGLSSLGGKLAAGVSGSSNAGNKAFACAA